MEEPEKIIPLTRTQRRKAGESLTPIRYEDRRHLGRNTLVEVNGAVMKFKRTGVYRAARATGG